MAPAAVPGGPWAPLAALLGAAGTAHFVRPAIFDRIVPRALPLSARTWTLASGVAELGLAAGLAVPATRRAAGWGAAALFLAVWPANGRQAHDTWRARGRSPAHARRAAAALVRMPMQVPLVLAAVRVARA